MNSIRQHVPSFVDIYPAKPEIATFSSLEELLAIPFVAQWRNTPGFIRFSKSDNARLMAEIRPSKTEPAGSYWVVGTLLDPSTVDLPAWVETPEQRKEREDWNAGRWKPSS